MSNHVAVVMAAGKGTRMESELPKVLVEVKGRPMVEYVLDALNAAGIQRILLVVGYRGDLVREALAGREGVEFAEQTEQLGTGHAVMMCHDQLAGHQDGVIVLAGDSPLTQADSLKNLLGEFDKSRPACLIGTTLAEDPTGLGRVVRDAEGNFRGIVEQKDATPEQQAIQEVNMSTYVFAGPELLWALDQLTTDNAQGEYYLTDCPGILQAAGKAVRAEPALQPCEALSINTMDQLANVEEEMTRLGYPGV